MKKRGRVILLLVLSFLLLLSFVRCGGKEEEETHKIGISVFSPSDPELSMFCDYYRDYIAESFPVEFLVSDTLNSAEDEIEFINEMKEQGVEGIISFYGLELERVVSACEENEMYYVLGSGSVSDEEFEAVKDNPWFLGVIGPNSDEEFNAGKDMAENFADQGALSFLIASGGAQDGGNFMHYTRVEGMLTALEEKLGLTYGDSIENLARSSGVTQIETGRDDVKIVISSGYFQSDEGLANLEQALKADDYDALLSAVGINDVMNLLTSDMEDGQKSMLTGVVDCFSEENYEAVEKKDASGQSLLNYVKGKYASMVAPAFAAMFNALEGDADVVKPDGTACRLYQSYWNAASEEEYIQLFNYTQNIYENAYSSVDLMEVIRAYDEDADFAKFEKLTQASDIESVRERLKG